MPAYKMLNDVQIENDLQQISFFYMISLYLSHATVYEIAVDTLELL